MWRQGHAFDVQVTLCKTAFTLDVCLNNICYSRLWLTLSPLGSAQGCIQRRSPFQTFGRENYNPFLKELSNILYTQFTFSPELVLCQLEEEEGALGWRTGVTNQFFSISDFLGCWWNKKAIEVPSGSNFNQLQMNQNQVTVTRCGLCFQASESV